MSVSVVLKNICPSIGEGPHWDEKCQSLLYIDINNGEIHNYETSTGRDSKITLGT
jgi:gluconolactonase